MGYLGSNSVWQIYTHCGNCQAYSAKSYSNRPSIRTLHKMRVEGCKHCGEKNLHTVRCGQVELNLPTGGWLGGSPGSGF
jgi:hypothetical protein